MRKLKLQVQMTLDGYIAGPNGEMGWMALPWTPDLEAYVGEITQPVDTILLGRKLAEGFIPYWASVASQADHPEVAAGQKFTETPKVVFSRTLAEPAWESTVLARDLIQEVSHLKQQTGGDLIAYGGATFVSSLIQHGLIDEYHLLINPVAIGQGMPIFQELTQYQQLTLVQTRSFACGIVLMHYVNKREG